MQIKLIDYTILEAFANLAALGSDDKLTDDEVQEYKDFVATLPKGFRFFNPNEGTFFGTCAITGLKGECATFTAFIREA